MLQRWLHLMISGIPYEIFLYCLVLTPTLDDQIFFIQAPTMVQVLTAEKHSAVFGHFFSAAPS